MNDKLSVRIITSTGIIHTNDDIISVNLSSYYGKMTILKNHSKIVGALLNSKVKIQNQNDSVDYFSCSNGVYFFRDNELAIICTKAQKTNIDSEFKIPDEFDIDEAKDNDNDLEFIHLKNNDNFLSQEIIDQINAELEKK